MSVKPRLRITPKNIETAAISMATYSPFSRKGENW